MARSPRRFIALALSALILAAHLPLPAAGGGGAVRDGGTARAACCGPKSCCGPAHACASGGGCATDPAAPGKAAPGPSLYAGNCKAPTPTVTPVSFDPVIQPRATAVLASTREAEPLQSPTRGAASRDAAPSDPPPRA